MKAIVYYAPGDIRYEDIPKPVRESGGLLVQVDACAVCGTDLKSKVHGNPRIKAPCVMGHEFTGIVVEGIDPYPAGRRIVMATSVSCGQCVFCQRGFRNLCTQLAPMSFSYPGGMAQYIAIPEAAVQGGHVIAVPEGVPAELAALAEPASCAVNAVSQCFDLLRLDSPQDFAPPSVLVMGAGPMGLLNAVAARAFGASKVFLTETNPLRRRQAERFDIDLILDPASQDIGEIVREQTGGNGADAVIVAAPAAAPQEQSLSFVRKRGIVCLFASLPAGNSALNIDSRLIHYNELRLIGSSDSTPQHVQKAVELIADSQKEGGTSPFDLIASHRLPLNEIERAFELMSSGEALRVVLLP